MSPVREPLRHRAVDTTIAWSSQSRSRRSPGHSPHGDLGNGSWDELGVRLILSRRASHRPLGRDRTAEGAWASGHRRWAGPSLPPPLADCQAQVCVGGGGVRSRVKRIFHRFHNPMVRRVTFSGSALPKASMITVRPHTCAAGPSLRNPVRAMGVMCPRAGAPAPTRPAASPARRAWPCMGFACVAWFECWCTEGPRSTYGTLTRDRAARPRVPGSTASPQARVAHRRALPGTAHLMQPTTIAARACGPFTTGRS
jgi:hypothetical protein